MPLPSTNSPLGHPTKDTQVNDFVRINYGSDPVPTVPGKWLGFSHVPRELHIVAENRWNWCGGNDNTEPGCSSDEVPHVISGNVDDHNGPYQGVRIGTIFCT